MTLGFVQDDRFYRLEIQPVNRVLDGHIGYRKLNQIMLREDIFDEFVYHCQMDNYNGMQHIISSVVDLAASELPYEKAENNHTHLLGI